jgi:hypothetical protein
MDQCKKSSSLATAQRFAFFFFIIFFQVCRLTTKTDNRRIKDLIYFENLHTQTAHTHYTHTLHTHTLRPGTAFSEKAGIALGT